MENIFQTENGDKAFASSGNYCLDFFVRITRNAPIKDYLSTFYQAWIEDHNTAFQILMNLRDPREGKGEKLIPIVIMVYLKKTLDNKIYEIILEEFLKYGCWKDLLRIIEIEIRMSIEFNTKISYFPEIKLFVRQLAQDLFVIDNNTDLNMKPAISLCAKWAPSENTHFDKPPLHLAELIRKEMNLTSKEYRQLLTKLRNHLLILEMLMSTQRFNEIDFSKIPSIAHLKTKNSFMRNTNSKGKISDGRIELHKSYSQYIQKLLRGDTKVNIRGIQPHELMERYHINPILDPLIETQWKTLRDKIIDSNIFSNTTAIVDVSSSMIGQPMHVAMALGILVSECTNETFKNKVITFHENPSWFNLSDISSENNDTLFSKFKKIKSAPWGGSTNLRAVFDLILETAIKTKTPHDQMVETLFIFTDMQFDSCDQKNNWESTFEYAKKIFRLAGYPKIPKIICWNLRTSSSKTLPIEMFDDGFAMLSGFSSELLKSFITIQEINPINVMFHILEKYTIPEFNTSNLNNCRFEYPDETFIQVLNKAIKNSTIKKQYRKK